MLAVTPVYAAILGIIFIILSVRTLKQRRQAQVALGYGQDKELLRRIRVHGNFSEYVPIALLLATFAELQAVSLFIVHLICILLLSGRILHAYGVSQKHEVFKYRVSGMAMTFASMVFSISAILVVSANNLHAS